MHLYRIPKNPYFGEPIKDHNTTRPRHIVNANAPLLRGHIDRSYPSIFADVLMFCSLFFAAVRFAIVESRRAKRTAARPYRAAASASQTDLSSHVAVSSSFGSPPNPRPGLVMAQPLPARWCTVDAAFTMLDFWGKGTFNTTNNSHLWARR